jgi:hypothetical protein
MRKRVLLRRPKRNAMRKSKPVSVPAFPTQRVLHSGKPAADDRVRRPDFRVVKERIERFSDAQATPSKEIAMKLAARPRLACARISMERAAAPTRVEGAMNRTLSAKEAQLASA